MFVHARTSSSGHPSLIGAAAVAATAHIRIVPLHRLLPTQHTRDDDVVGIQSRVWSTVAVSSRTHVCVNVHSSSILGSGTGGSEIRSVEPSFAQSTQAAPSAIGACGRKRANERSL